MTESAPIQVISHGVATSVRSGGRTGFAHLGHGRGGAVDLHSLRLANRLVGNHPDAAAWETSGGLLITVRAPVMIAVTGSPAELFVARGPAVGWGVPEVLPSGSSLRIGRLDGGARTYLAVRGGIHGAGPSTVDIGPAPVDPPSEHTAVPRLLDGSPRVWPGPRRDWFEADAWTTLLRSTWTVRPASDRVGLRLAGPPLQRVSTIELPSEGLVEGAIQVPPDGQPIVMLADHPTTGGYPVIAVVDPSDIGLVAQRPPGSTIQFTRARA